jgi:cell filamentation protein
MSDEIYCYPPDFKVLRNRFNIRDEAELDAVEREFVVQRLREPSPTGAFDRAHLQAIHRHLFQDMYDWAGELRVIEISKGGSQFQFVRFIETGLKNVHDRLIQRNFLKALDAPTFAGEAGQILGDVNYVHPFREGNGRAQMVYLTQLAERAGHLIDLTRINKSEWLTASRDAHLGHYGRMERCILEGIMKSR